MKRSGGVCSQATELLTIEATGDFALMTDISVDITPVFPAAGEQ